MSIIYIISTILLFVLSIFLEKTKEKLEIVKTLVITVIVQLAYNALTCYILNLVNIPITLISLSIINFIISTVIIWKMKKDNAIQKYKLERRNIIIVVFFILLAIVLLNCILSNSGKIRYLTGDPENHYRAAREFSENTCLSNKAKTNNSISPSFMIMGYTNEGIVCKVLKPYMGTIRLYNVYIAFEVILYALSAIMFYFLIEKCCKNKYNYIIAFIFTIFYVLGYPLNAWISGFHYLLIGMIYIIAIIYAINEINIEFKYKLLIMLLLNFGLMFSYCLFCPSVYLAEFIYYIYKYFKKDKMKLLYLTITTLVIPGIMGLTYVLIAQFNEISNSITLEGYIYKNLWANFIFFVPFVIYNIYDNIKNKRKSLDDIMFIILIIYILVLFISTKLDKCSHYYFFKNYFALWILIIDISIRGMIKFSQNGKNEKILIITIVIVYITIFTLSVSFINTPQRRKSKDSLSNIMEVFTLNNTMIRKMGTVLTKGEYNLFLELEEQLDNKWKEYNSDDIIFITDRLQEMWIKSLVGHSNDILKYEEKNKINTTTIEKIKNNTYEYIVVTKETDAYKKYFEFINTDKLNLIYENEVGMIYKKIV